MSRKIALFGSDSLFRQSNRNASIFVQSDSDASSSDDDDDVIEIGTSSKRKQAAISVSSRSIPSNLRQSKRVRSRKVPEKINVDDSDSDSDSKPSLSVAPSKACLEAMKTLRALDASSATAKRIDKEETQIQRQEERERGRHAAAKKAEEERKAEEIKKKATVSRRSRIVPPPRQKLHIKVRFSAKRIDQVDIYEDEMFDTMLTAICEKEAWRKSKTKLQFDGENVPLTKTPKFYDMEDDDMMDIVNKA